MKRFAAPICLGLIAGLLLAAPASGLAASPSPSPLPSPSPSPLTLPSNIPPTIGGLSVTRENISNSLKGLDQTQYLDTVALYSLRGDGKFLEATLEIGHFRAGTQQVGSRDFQLTIVAAIGNTVPVEMQVGGHTVFYTTVKGLQLIVWFRGNYLIVLAIRDAYPQQKTLIRSVVDVKP
jgi:hypothetical protein